VPPKAALTRLAPSLGSAGTLLCGLTDGTRAWLARTADGVTWVEVGSSIAKHASSDTLYVAGAERGGTYVILTELLPQDAFAPNAWPLQILRTSLTETLQSALGAALLPMLTPDGRCVLDPAGALVLDVEKQTTYDLSEKTLRGMQLVWLP
jgi:hypothetical protein